MSDQGLIYYQFIEGEVKAERERRAALDTRSQALVTSSGVLVTLLTGVAAVAGVRLATASSQLIVGVVALALVLFVCAAACGIGASWNRHYAVTQYVTLDTMLGAHWADDIVDARNNVSTLHAATVDTLRTANNFKARFVTLGLTAQILALATLGTATFMALALA